MSKFDRKTQKLKSRVQFVRGRLHKSRKGLVLTEAETDDLSDQVIEDLLNQGVVEATDKDAADDAEEGDADPAAAPVKGGGK